MKNKTKLIFNIIPALAFFVFCCSCSNAAAGLKGNVEIAGSSTVYPITVAVAEEFIKKNPGVNIPVRSTGTGGGFKNFFIPGRTAINDASRRIKEGEFKQAEQNGITPLEFQVGIDAITIVVNKKCPVNNITVAQLEHIWRPEDPAQKWNEVDPSWPDAELELYGPSSASGTFDYFTKKIMGEERSSRPDYQKTELDNTIVQAVKGSTAALGYFGMAYYLENQQDIKALKVNGVQPGLQAAKEGTYTPLARPIFIYVSSKALKKPAVRKFVKFYLQQTGTDLIKEVGYVPLPPDMQQENMKKFTEAVKKYT
ncbi:MAG TPA: PstS family phosphate ABC transporter substrate-binding protein [Spirochaetota bacterium]|nr:PstS family phosphate ABC transporter substrate-binding protein [Spirochaetota bacterium]